MVRTVAVMLALSLGIAAPAWAKGKKKADAKAIKLPKKPEYKAPGGPLPPLPKPTELSLHFAGDATEAETYTAAASAVTAVTAATAKHLAWNVGQWRKQLSSDVKQIRYLRKLLGKEVTAARQSNFPVAVRYVSGSYDSATQLMTLSEQSMTQFNVIFTTDRDAEILKEPPEAARRVRLYLDRVTSLYYDARRFVARSTQSREEKVVRLDESKGE